MKGGLTNDVDIIQHSFIWNRRINRLCMGKEQKMTREEAIEKLNNAKGCPLLYDSHIEAIGMAIQALSQEPCDDAISREDAEECKELMTDINGDTVYAVRMSDIRQLPSVTQKSVLEQIKAEIEAARYGLINDGLDVALRIIDKHIEGR